MNITWSGVILWRKSQNQMISIGHVANQIKDLLSRTGCHKPQFKGSVGLTLWHFRVMLNFYWIILFNFALCQAFTNKGLLLSRPLQQVKNKLSEKYYFSCSIYVFSDSLNMCKKNLGETILGHLTYFFGIHFL